MPKQLPNDLAQKISSVLMTFNMELPLDTDFPSVQVWHVKIEYENWGENNESDEPTKAEIGFIRLAKCSLLEPSLWEELDAMDGDLSAVGESVLNINEGGLKPEVSENMESFIGNSLLILDSVEINPEWRGFGIGPLLAGQAIIALEDDVRCVATYPSPRGCPEGVERDRITRKLQHTWASLGFEQFDDDVWTIDPGMTYLEDSVKRLRSNFGLSD